MLIISEVVTEYLGEDWPDWPQRVATKYDSDIFNLTPEFKSICYKQQKKKKTDFEPNLYTRKEPVIPIWQVKVVHVRVHKYTQ